MRRDAVCSLQGTEAAVSLSQSFMRNTACHFAIALDGSLTGAIVSII